MWSACLQVHIQQRKTRKRFTNPVKLHRGTATANNCHAHAVARVTADRLIDFALTMFNLPVDQRKIQLENFARAKLIRQVFMRSFSLSDDEQARGALVESMDYAGPGRAASR